MKKRLKVLLPCIAILLALATALTLLGRLVEPKYLSEQKEGGLVRDYYKETSSHDVLFVGDCEVYENFTPATLYAEYGITSYIRGSAQQLVWQSYYLLEEMLKTETPKVVVYNVLALKYGEPQNEAYNRMTLDGMKPSLTKWKAVMASMTHEESFASSLLPLLRFHDRIGQLSAEDFDALFSRPTVSYKGYLMQTGVEGGVSDREGIPLTDYTLPKTSMEYLEKMRLICEEKGVELILIKSPTNHWKYYWYDEWDEQVKDYAEAHGLSYYNFIPLCDEIGIDWNTDTYDKGAHLNVYGAEKLTAYFGKVLTATRDFDDRREDETIAAEWDELVKDYEAAKGESK